MNLGLPFSKYQPVPIKHGPKESLDNASVSWMENTFFIQCYHQPRREDSEADCDVDIAPESSCGSGTHLGDVHTKHILFISQP